VCVYVCAFLCVCERARVNVYVCVRVCVLRSTAGPRHRPLAMAPMLPLSTLHHPSRGYSHEALQLMHARVCALHDRPVDVEGICEDYVRGIQFVVRWVLLVPQGTQRTPV
jgi:hypothetical protein